MRYNLLTSFGLLALSACSSPIVAPGNQYPPQKRSIAAIPQLPPPRNDSVILLIRDLNFGQKGVPITKLVPSDISANEARILPDAFQSELIATVPRSATDIARGVAPRELGSYGLVNCETIAGNVNLDKQGHIDPPGRQIDPSQNEYDCLTNGEKSGGKPGPFDFSLAFMLINGVKQSQSIDVTEDFSLAVNLPALTLPSMSCVSPAQTVPGRENVFAICTPNMVPDPPIGTPILNPQGSSWNPVFKFPQNGLVKVEVDKNSSKPSLFQAVIQDTNTINGVKKLLTGLNVPTFRFLNNDSKLVISNLSQGQDSWSLGALPDFFNSLEGLSVKLEILWDNTSNPPKNIGQKMTILLNSRQTNEFNITESI